MTKTITTLSYNVHSCVGSDWKYSPARVAQTIKACAPDLVALQELDRNTTNQKTGLW